MRSRVSAPMPSPTDQRRGPSAVERIYNWRILILILLLAAIFSIVSADFFKLGTVEKVLFLLPAEGTVAIGMTLVMIMGELDVSVGGVFALSGIVMYRLLPYGIVPAVAAALAVGALIGLFNGLLVFKLKVNSLIATIAVSFVLSGVALLTLDKTYQVNNSLIVGFGNSSLWLFPYAAIFYILLTVLIQFALKRTPLGIKLYAVGGSRLSSAYTGISVDRTGITIFVLSGLFAALGGLLYSARLGAASPKYGEYVPIYVITAVLLGGTTLSGGYGDVVKSFLGILLLSLFSKGFTLLQIPAFYQNMIIGAFLILLLYAGKKLSERRTGPG
jgi:ribose transport system permease protein